MYNLKEKPEITCEKEHVLTLMNRDLEIMFEGQGQSLGTHSSLQVH